MYRYIYLYSLNNCANIDIPKWHDDECQQGWMVIYCIQCVFNKELLFEWKWIKRVDDKILSIFIYIIHFFL